MKKFNEYKQWLSDKLPTFSPSTQKHFYVVFIIANFLGIWSSSNPKFSFIGFICLAIGIIGWELRTLIHDKFSKESIAESKRDLVVGFIAMGVIAWLVFLRYKGI